MDGHMYVVLVQTLLINSKDSWEQVLFLFGTPYDLKLSVAAQRNRRRAL